MRPLEENDVWCLDQSRKANTVSRDLEINFYARCPPDIRPARLQGARSTELHADPNHSEHTAERGM